MTHARCLIRKAFAVLQYSMTSATIAALTIGAVPCRAQQLTNDALSVTVNGQDGSYQFGPVGSQSTLQASIGALVDHMWLRPASYRSHSVSESQFSDSLGSGRQLTVTYSGLRDSPDLILVLQLYTQNPYGTVQVRVRNTIYAKRRRCRQSAVWRLWETQSLTWVGMQRMSEFCPIPSAKIGPTW